jgi:hypothetical protein
MTIRQQGGVFGRNPTFNDVTIPDGGQIAFGNSADLKIYHDGSASYISETGTGNLFIDGGNLRLRNADGTKVYLLANSADKTDIYFDGAVKIRTESTGAKILGNLSFDAGNGIDFSATSGTGTSELFDDYEEGLAGGITLSPETSGSFTMNAALDTLAYTKVGRLVSITGMISCTNVSAVGTFVELDGLPFAAADLTETAGRFTGMAQFDGTSGKPSVVGLALEGWTKIRFPIDASTVTGNIYVNINYIAA